MKIRKVILRNLNSLKVAQPSDIIEIDFTSPPLNYAGIFAIVGDTGAGKTTILDAITLAFYGKVHRNGNEKEIMSYGATESLAEVEFEVKKEIYRAKWTLSKAYSKADGKIKTPDRELSQLEIKTGKFKILHEGVRGFETKVQEITGLDYNQFCKSVLLAQGDFAAFLSANEKERSELLERITGTAHYSKLSQAAYERHASEEKKLEQLNEQLQQLNLLKTTTPDVLEAQILANTKAIDEYQQALQALRQQLSWLQGLTALHAKTAQTKQQIQKITTEQIAQSPRFEQLLLHQKAIPFQEQLQRLEDLSKERDQIKTSIQEIVTAQANLQVQLDTTAVELAEVTPKLEQLQQEREPRFALFERVLQLDERIAQKKIEIVSLKKNWKVKNDKQHKEIQQSSNLQNELQILENQIVELTDWLKENDKYQNLEKDLAALALLLQESKAAEKTVKEWESTQEILGKSLVEKEKAEHLATKQVEDAEAYSVELNRELLKFTTPQELKKFQSRTELVTYKIAAIQQLKDFCSLLKIYTDTQSEIDQLDKQLQTAKAELEISTAKVKSLERKLPKLQEEYQARKRHYDLELAYSNINFEQTRTQLQPGEPCPVCRSVHHPFRDLEWDTTYVDDAHQLVEIANTALEKVQKQLNVAEQQYAVLASKQENLSISIHTKVERLSALKQQVLGISPVENFTFGDLDNLLLQISNYQSNIVLAEENLMLLKEITAKIELQEQRKNKAALEQKELVAAIKSEIERFKQQTKYLYDAKESLRQTLSNAIQYLVKYQLENYPLATAYTTLEQNLASFKTKSEQLRQFLEKSTLYRQQLAGLAQQLQERQEGILGLEQEMQAAETQQTQWQSERTNLLGNKNPQVEKQAFQTQLQTIEQLWEQLRNQLQTQQQEKTALQASQTTSQSVLERFQQQGQTLQTSLLENIKKEGFTNINAVRAAILPESEAQQIKLLKEKMQTELHHLQELLKDTALQFEAEQSKKLTQLQEVDLQTQLAALEETHQNTLQQLGSLKEQLEQQKKLAHQVAQLQVKYEQQKKEYIRWKKLNDVIGMKNGNKFRVFAQSLTLQQLVYYANQHLKKLNERYYIRKREGEALELDIIDLFQANHSRSMKTLSGGESFLASLALALGLSDLAGHNAQIRSLFIDEGFGTLDDATLEVAITTLENLQATGKTIGIISHVKALKERITTQIQVQKKGSGFSQIKIVG